MWRNTKLWSVDSLQPSSQTQITVQVTDVRSKCRHGYADKFQFEQPVMRYMSQDSIFSQISARCTSQLCHMWKKSSKLEDCQLERMRSTKSLSCRQIRIKAGANVPVARERSTSLRPQRWSWFCQGRPEGALGTDLGCRPAGGPPKV